MRLDKYLKLSRIIKRRTIAKEVCDQGNVLVNQRPAKAGLEIKPGDIIEAKLGNKVLGIEVLSAPETIRAKDVSDLYHVLD